MIKIPEYFQIREHILKDELITIISVITKEFNISGNDVRRLIKQNSIKFRALKDIKDDLFLNDPNELASESIGRILYIGKKKALYVKACPSTKGQVSDE